MYYAAREGHYQLAEKLIELGADPNNEDNNGQTALFYSAREGHKDLCMLLIKKGANPNQQDKKHQTPLHLAKKHNKQDVMQFLLENGATPLKEASAEKAKSSKKGSSSKSKPSDVNSPKKYVLTLYKDGNWRPVNAEELKEFLENNKEVASYLLNPENLSKLKVPPASESMQIFDHWDKAAKKILGHLWKHQGAWHFHEPVDPEKLNIPDYTEIIKNPMDFGTIKKKLATSAYSKCQEFCDDMELVFSNCIRYNTETSDFGILAKNLREEFKKQCQLLSLDYYM